MNVGSEYLKYKIIPNSYTLLSWAEARKNCEDEGATMWEVMSEVEWNRIYQILKDKSREGIWINGESSEECDDLQKVGKCICWGNGIQRHVEPFSKYYVIDNGSISVQTAREGWQGPARIVAIDT